MARQHRQVRRLSALRYRRLERRLACENSLFQVFFDAIETPSGPVVPDFLIVRPKVAAPGGVIGVCVLPEQNGRIGLMKGWRHQLDDEVWQAPAGFIDPNETAAQAALRELGEETGLTCDPSNLRSLGTYYPDAGLIEGRVALFVARFCFHAEHLQNGREVGAGNLQFVDRKMVQELLAASASIGGSTMIAAYRYLAIQED